jgi:hypothetical protein
MELWLSAFADQLRLSDQGDFDIWLLVITVRDKESFVHATSSEISSS